jgi:hypothetical protein
MIDSMITKKMTCFVVLFFGLFLKNHGQQIEFTDSDSLSLPSKAELNSFYFNSKRSHVFGFTNSFSQNKKPESSINLKLGYLNDYKVKTYNMSEFHIHHRLDITPGFIKDRYPLPPHVNHQNIEVIKRKKKGF